MVCASSHSHPLQRRCPSQIFVGLRKCAHQQKNVRDAQARVRDAPKWMCARVQGQGVCNAGQMCTHTGGDGCSQQSEKRGLPSPGWFLAGRAVRGAPGAAAAPFVASSAALFIVASNLSTCPPRPGPGGADGWGSGEQCPPGNCHLTIPILRSYDNDRLVGNQHPDRPLGKFQGYASATTSPHTSGQCVAYFCGGDHSAKKIIRGAAHRRFWLARRSPGLSIEGEQSLHKNSLSVA